MGCQFIGSCVLVINCKKLKKVGKNSKISQVLDFYNVLDGDYGSPFFDMVVDFVRDGNLRTYPIEKFKQLKMSYFNDVKEITFRIVSKNFGCIKLSVKWCMRSEGKMMRCNDSLCISRDFVNGIVGNSHPVIIGAVVLYIPSSF